MLTGKERRRLCEWRSQYTDPEQSAVYGECASCDMYTNWDSVMPLLAEIVERRQWLSFTESCRKQVGGDRTEELFANFTDPSHTAGLVAEWLERKEE